jgi:hypothetical protein
MANFNASLSLDVSFLTKLATDPELGAKLATAVQGAMFGGKDTISYDGKDAVKVVEAHQADQCRVIVVGNNTGRDLGLAGPASNMEEGSERALFEALLDNHDLVVRNEPKERTAEEKEATKQKAMETRARNAALKASSATPSAS